MIDHTIGGVRMKPLAEAMLGVAADDDGTGMLLDGGALDFSGRVARANQHPGVDSRIQFTLGQLLQLSGMFMAPLVLLTGLIQGSKGTGFINNVEQGQMSLLLRRERRRMLEGLEGGRGEINGHQDFLGFNAGFRGRGGVDDLSRGRMIGFHANNVAHTPLPG